MESELLLEERLLLKATTLETANIPCLFLYKVLI